MPRAASSTGPTSCGATRTAPGPGPADGVESARRLAPGQPFKPPFPADVPQPTGGAARNAIPLYDFPNVTVVKHYLPDAPLRTSALRTLGGYANVFALESFVDEMAAAAGADPVEFRLRHLKDPRARAVIEAAAQRAGWTPEARGDGGRGRGFAFSKYKNLACYCALVADVDRRSPSGAGPGHAGGGRGRRRADRQPGRRAQPDRGRHHPVGELDAEGIAALRSHAGHHPIVGRLSDPDVRRGARGRGGAARSARPSASSAWARARRARPPPPSPTRSPTPPASACARCPFSPRG